MSGRSRLPRKAAETVSYTYAAPSSDEDEPESSSDEEVGGKGKRASTGKGKAPKRRRVEADESDESEGDEGDSETEDEEDDGVADGVLSKLPRVDFSRTLPLELIGEIFSYLHPASLFALSTLNKTFHSLLTGDATRKTWLNALKVEKLPKLDGEEVMPTKLCALILDKTCQFCGEEKVVAPDRFLLLRLCTSCREANLVPIAEVGAGKKYSDFHPATTQCVSTTRLPPSRPDLRWERDSVYVCWSDLQHAHETLEALQLEDDLEAENPLVETDMDGRAVAKKLGKARKLKKRWRSKGHHATAKQLEEEVVSQWTPKVRDFVRERRAMEEKKDKLAAWIQEHQDRLIASRQREMSEARSFAARGAELCRESFGTVWRSSPLVAAVCSTGLLSDQTWEEIKDTVYGLIGEIAAPAIWKRHVRKMEREGDSEDEGSGRIRMPKKPKSVTATAWKYILPEVRKVAKASRSQERVKPVKPLQPAKAPTQPAEDSNANYYIPWDKLQPKTAFFKKRYQKLSKLVPSASRPYLPVFDDFLELPTVKVLYRDLGYGVGAVDDKGDSDRWGEALDDVLEEVGSHMLDVRFRALKLILAATTEMDEAEIDALDPDCLADEEYGDDFFAKPAHFVCCSGCGYFGALASVLSHQASCRPYYYRPSKTFDIDLPLEVACAASAIFELIDLDADDSSVTEASITSKMDGRRVTWENAPKWKGGKRTTWKHLLTRVHTAAKQYDPKNLALPAPVISLNREYKGRWSRWSGYRW
ncbi:hypothetical protein JCM10213_006645 [Rhodosporidiobolus nylandii]